MLALSTAHILSLRSQSSLEPLVLCRAAAWQPMGHVLGRVQPGWKRACVSLGCRWFEINCLKTWSENRFSLSPYSLLLSVLLSSSCFSIPFGFASLRGQAASGRNAFALVLLSLCPGSFTSDFWLACPVK